MKILSRLFPSVAPRDLRKQSGAYLKVIAFGR